MTVDFALLTRQILLSGGVTARVVTDIPASAPTPLVKVEKAGGERRRSDLPNWMRTAEVQLDVWATSPGGLQATFEQCATILLEAPRNDPAHAAGIVTLISVPEPSRVDDTDWRTSDDSPMPRLLSIVRISAHPVPV